MFKAGTKSLSAPMYALTLMGFSLWFAYGVALGQWSSILINGICAVLAGVILFMTLASIYRSAERHRLRAKVLRRHYARPRNGLA